MTSPEACAADRPGDDLRRPLHEILDERARRTPDGTALVFLADGAADERRMSWRDLSLQARSLAGRLVNAGASGSPVLLAQEPGNAFVVSLFACWHAGALAIPAHPAKGARHRQRLAAVLRDSGARVAIGTTGGPRIDGVRFLDSRDAEDSPADLPTVPGDAPCLLQYTSGSTSDPKGVVLRHHQLRGHYQALSAAHGADYSPVLSWLPHYHDMGLVLKILFAFESGSPLIHFPPARFILRPVSWLQAISRHRVEMSGAPNFAYEACLRTVRDEDLAGLDLSSWKAAPCGAERVRPETMERFARRFASCGFRPDAFLPGYGLAEATLTVTSRRPGDAQVETRHPVTGGRLASCGEALPGIRLRIADPDSGATLADGDIGEIRVSGPTLADGYFRRDAPADSFGGELATGDLGFLRDSRLFVTGRLKDLIILDGVNHAPEDIEEAVVSALPGVRAAAAVAETIDGRECASLLVEHGASAENGFPALCRLARRRVSDALNIPLHRVAVVREGLLPRTTSGKVRRRECAMRLADGTLALRHDDLANRSAETAPDDGTTALVLAAAAEVTGFTGLTAADDPTGCGIGSLDATRLVNRLRAETGRALTLGDVFSATSFAELASTLARRPHSDGGGAVETRSSTGTLTHAQERMWFLHQMDPQSAAYHVFGVLALHGPLDPSRLEHAFRAVVSRHDILTSRHGIDDGRPLVWSAPEEPPSFATAASDTIDARELLSDFARRPFALDAAPPIRALLIALPDGGHLFAVCAHHIAADGWSMRLLARELAGRYANPRADLPPAPSYLAAAPGLRARVDRGDFRSQLDFWVRRLTGHPGIIPLPVDFPRPPAVRSDGALVERHLSADLRLAVADFARAHRVTPFMVQLTALLLLLRGHGAGDDLVIAIPVANRNRADTEPLVGTLVNTLPFRQRIDPRETIASLLAAVREASLEMQENQDIPFEAVITALQPERASDHPPLAQVMFDHQEIPLHESWGGGVRCAHHPAHRGAAQFDLSLLLTTFADHEVLSIEYRTDLFLPRTAGLLLDRLVHLLERVCLSPDQPCGGVPVATPDELGWLETHGRGPDRPSFLDRTPLESMLARAAKHPDRTAVTADGARATYQEWSGRARSVAAALRARGIRPGDRVAVLIERDIGLPSTLCGIWLAGAAYVPLDRANPPERLRRILEDQGDIAVLVSPGLENHLPGGLRTIPIDDAFLPTPPETAVHIPRPEDAAYVIYTSGSTGIPKGVVVPHGALGNFLLSMAESPGFTEADRMLALTTVSFDISTLELFLPLLAGGSVEIVPGADTRDAAALRTRIETSAATVIQATPATWRMLLDTGWTGAPSLKLLCGGEALDAPLARELAGRGCQLWNLYGPTETTVWSTIWQVPAAPAADIRIGTPVANTGVHVVSPGGNLLPPGVTGELWISGAGLADGYWRSPEKTRERFVEPHATGPPARAYRTGDLARWHPDGTLECLGRSDGQVKIRGFRVELGEIDAALASHPRVSQARSALRGSAGAARIVAWVVPAEPAPCPVELREHLAARLPAYMLPADVGVIRRFPLNSSGKVDVAALPDPEAPVRPADRPPTAAESELIAIWSELLDRPVIHPDDDWFHIGGHSLLALRMFARIHRDLGARLPFSAILEHPTPRRLAAAIDRSRRP